MPAPLPPRLALTAALLGAAERARGALGEFIDQARLVHNDDLVIGPLIRREAVLSSRIEGTRTEIHGVLRAQADPDQRVEENSELYEVLNYLHTLNYGKAWIEEGRPINLG